MYTNLDYDYENDLYCIKGTKIPYTGEHEMYESMDDNYDDPCRMSGYIDNGKRDGLWKWFKEDGSFEKSQTWIEDNLVS